MNKQQLEDIRQLIREEVRPIMVEVVQEAIAPLIKDIAQLKQDMVFVKDQLHIQRQMIEANRKAIEANRKAIEANRKAIETNRKAIEANTESIQAIIDVSSRELVAVNNKINSHEAKFTKVHKVLTPTTT